jgi:RimJ/RimL family protein N-acetyltransferase
MIMPSEVGARAPTMQHDVVIRRMQPGEEGLYRAMRLQALRLNPRVFGSTYAETVATPVLPFEKFIAADDEENPMFGAFTRGELGGTCGLYRETRERSRHRAELVHMFVAPWLQGQGVGAQLVETAVQYGLDRIGLRQIVLGVIAENEPAVRLYRRAGFREYGRLERFFCGEIGCAEKLFMVYERS